MRDHLRRLSALHLAPVRTAHAWFDGDAGTGAAVADLMASGIADATAKAQQRTAEPPAGDQPPADTPPTDRELHALRTKAGRLERELEALRKADEDRKNADLSEVDRLKKELAARDAAIEAAATQAKAGRLAGASLAAAARLGFADPEDAQRFLDADAVEWDDSGAPKNVQALLEAVLKAKPYLKASFTQTPDLGQGNRGGSSIPLTRDAIAKMSPGEINARWDEVQKVMAKG